MEQAIDIVEFLGQDFKKFRSYKIQTDDRYTKAYNFLKQNENVWFNKCQLLNEFCTYVFSREPLRKNFHETLQFIEEIAEMDGYKIRYEDKILKNGTLYMLTNSDFANYGRGTISKPYNIKKSSPCNIYFVLYLFIYRKLTNITKNTTKFSHGSCAIKINLL